MEKCGIEYAAGLQWNEGEFYRPLCNELRLVVRMATGGVMDEKGVWLAHDFGSAAVRIEKAIQANWPGRAFFLEVGKEDEWVQIFQPYDLPRKVKPPVPVAYQLASS